MAKTRKKFTTAAPAGLTFVELLVALIVTSIILSAVAAMAFAMSTAVKSSDDTASRQAQLRYATLKLTELIEHCRLVCAAQSDYLLIWKSDYDNDGCADPNELVYIEKGTDSDSIVLCEFVSSGTGSLDNMRSLTFLSTDGCRSQLKLGYGPRYITVISDCSDIQFLVDVQPAYTKYVTVSFKMSVDGVSAKYQITAALQCRAENLVSSDGSTLVEDDD